MSKKTKTPSSVHTQREESSYREKTIASVQYISYNNLKSVRTIRTLLDLSPGDKNILDEDEYEELFDYIKQNNEIVVQEIYLLKSWLFDVVTFGWGFGYLWWFDMVDSVQKATNALLAVEVIAADSIDNISQLLLESLNILEHCRSMLDERENGEARGQLLRKYGKAIISLNSTYGGDSDYKNEEVEDDESEERVGAPGFIQENSKRTFKN